MIPSRGLKGATKVGILGYGHLGVQLGIAFDRASLQVEASCRTPSQHTPLGRVRLSSSRWVAREADYLWLAVKPRQLTALAEQVGEDVVGKHLISMMAGVTPALLHQCFPYSRTFRCMTSLAFGEGASLNAVAASGETLESHPEVKSLLETGGSVFTIDDKMMNSFTSAYACMLGWMDRLEHEGHSLPEILTAIEEAVPPYLADQELGRRVVGALPRSYAALRRKFKVGEIYQHVATPGGMTHAGWESISRALGEGQSMVAALNLALVKGQRIADGIDGTLRGQLGMAPAPGVPHLSMLTHHTYGHVAIDPWVTRLCALSRPSVP